MTRIEAEYDQRTGHCRLTANGHAEGSEQVCAAVSALLGALAGYMENARRSGAVTVWKQQLSGGRAELDFMSSGEEGCGAFLAVCVGLLQVAEQHPDYAEISLKERTFFKK